MREVFIRKNRYIPPRYLLAACLRLNFNVQQLRLLFILAASLFVLNGYATSVLKLNNAIADAQDPKIVHTFENKINDVVN